MSDGPIAVAEYGVGVLAGRRIPIAGQVPENQLARFNPKITIGDNNRDSDDLISVWVQSTWLGGGQAFIVNAQSQDSRFWDALNMDTEYPNMLSLRARTDSFSAPSGVTGTFAPLRDCDDVLYGVWGSTLCAWNGTDWDEVAALDGEPVAKGCVYDGLLYIPLGSNGLNSFDPAGPTVDLVMNGVDGVNARDVIVWDDKLLVLTPENSLLIFDGATWTGGTSPYTIKTGEISRHLILFHNTGGDPAVYINTSRGIWAYAPESNKLFRILDANPPHPTQGRAAAVWRNTDMYLSIGTGAHSWNGDVLNPMGLDRDQGLRAELRGAIVDFEPEYNGLMALVSGATVDTDLNTLFHDNPMIEETSTVFPSQQSVSSLWRFTGFGWHKVWESTDASGSPSWTVVTADEAGTRYALWWGYGDKAYRHNLRREFYNPQEAARIGVDTFERSGWLRTGRWNANMPAWPKLASRLDVNVLERSQGTIQIEYQTNETVSVDPDTGEETATWLSLGEINIDAPLARPTRYRFYFGPNFVDDEGRTYDGSNPEQPAIPVGTEFDWIEFRYTFTRPDETTSTTPIVDSFVFKFIKIPLATLSWTLQVPLVGFDEQFFGFGPDELANWLSTLAAANKFVPFTFGDRTFRALVAQSTANRSTGEKVESTFNLTILEVS